MWAIKIEWGYLCRLTVFRLWAHMFASSRVWKGRERVTGRALDAAVFAGKTWVESQGLLLTRLYQIFISSQWIRGIVLFYIYIRAVTKMATFIRIFVINVLTGTYIVKLLSPLTRCCLGVIKKYTGSRKNILFLSQKSIYNNYNNKQKDGFTLFASWRRWHVLRNVHSKWINDGETSKPIILP